jgi:hypothetical protein
MGDTIRLLREAVRRLTAGLNRAVLNQPQSE